MANFKTKQAKERVLTLLRGNGPVPLELIYSQCECDHESLAGALSSLVEKGEVQLGRQKARQGWLLAEGGEKPAGPVSWQQERGQVRTALSEIVRELKKHIPPENPGGDDPEEAVRIEALLSDGRPRTLAEILSETGLDQIRREVRLKFPQLPDGRYTVPDSSGAWEYLNRMLSERPRRLTDLLRRFSRHKEIVAALTSEGEGAPFVRLPRSLVTVRESREGQAELKSRRELKEYEDILRNLQTPFFKPEELDLDLQLFLSIADRHALPVEFDGEKYWMLRREFPGEDIVEQLGDISGRYFAPPYRISPYAFLKEKSSGEKDILSIFNIDRHQLDFLLDTRALDFFTLDGSVRIWRSVIEELRGSKKLEDLSKLFGKVNIPEAAVSLGVPIGQVRRLIDEGYITPVSQKNLRAGAGYMLYSRHVEELRGRLPEILAAWRQEGKKKEPAVEEDGRPARQMRKRPNRREEQEPLPQGEFTLDRFQVEAIEALLSGHSVLVAAPTGNGKTLVAEKLAEKLMADGRGLIYTSPLKALSNQKYRDFREMFGEEKVGLVTGDISNNPGAPLLVMTTEIFRNWCLGEPEQLEKTAYVIFDEIHYLDDAERGTTWEESILFAPAHVKILGLSATVPNVEEIAGWISSVRGEKMIIVKESKRHVPLGVRWVLPNCRIVREAEAQREVADLVEYLKSLRNKKRWFEE